MGDFAEILSPITNLLGGPKQPDIPEPKIPAAPAPSRREDTGAKVSIGSDNAKNARVSGGGRGNSSKSSGDVLGGLGGGGLNL